MRSIVLSYVAFTDLPHFPTLFHKRHNFLKRIYWKNVFWFFLWGLSEIFLVQRKERNIITNVLVCSCTEPIILPKFSWDDFFDIFSKNLQIPNLIKISPLGAELFHAGGETDGQDGHTDMMKLILAFRCFAKANKNV